MRTKEKNYSNKDFFPMFCIKYTYFDKSVGKEFITHSPWFKTVIEAEIWFRNKWEKDKSYFMNSIIESDTYKIGNI